MTNPLPPLPDPLAALVRAARETGPTPPAGVEDALLAKLAASVAPAAAAAGVGGAAAQASAWGLGKGAAALVLGATVLGGGALLVLRPAAPYTHATSAVEPGPGAPATPPAPQLPAPPLPVPPGAAEAASASGATPAPAAPATRSGAPLAEPTASATPRPKAPAPPSAAEGALLEQARDALARGDAATARDRLLEHERRFPDGRLVEERRALTVVALVRLGQRERAQAAARAFEAAHPGSLFQDTVRAALGD